MAYAIPKGTEGSVADSYGPWHNAEVKQVFYKDSSIVQAVLCEIQMILSWRYSEAQQYIIDANLSNNVIALDPTADVKMKVHFDNPSNYGGEGLEAYEIPFRVEVAWDPVGTNSTTIYRGTMRADGTGTFNQI
jgi:hypothetical protein